jgi:hypothetical protein
MIGKQVKGSSFSGVLNYLHHKAEAKRIGGNMAGETPRQLAGEFRHAIRLNPDLKSPVYHASLSVARAEEQSDGRWMAIAQDYINGMGFRNCQYVVYRHHDQEHDHIHIVASRIQITDGKTVSDSWDYRRSQQLLRELETKYDLQPVQSSWEKGQRSPTTGESRMMEEKGNVSVRLKLQAIINDAIAPDKRMPDFVAAIQQQGVSVRLSQRTGGISGISYEMEGVAFSGTHLGRDFTFPGLQKHRHLNYVPNRDDEALARLVNQAISPQQAEPVAVLPTPSLPEPKLSHLNSDDFNSDDSDAIASPVSPAAIDPLQQQAAELIAPIAVALFQSARREGSVTQTGADSWKLIGNQYVMSFERSSGVFSLEARDGRGELLRLRGSEGTENLEIAQRIVQQDLLNFQRIQETLQQEKVRSWARENR